MFLKSWEANLGNFHTKHAPRCDETEHCHEVGWLVQSQREDDFNQQAMHIILSRSKHDHMQKSVHLFAHALFCACRCKLIGHNPCNRCTCMNSTIGVHKCTQHDCFVGTLQNSKGYAFSDSNHHGRVPAKQRDGHSTKTRA